uniref:Uncharacterized protein n=1 Tax=Ascaris lumbricoides TaxID=6252 RepID=A0A0M3HFL0_ASCLU
MSSFEWAKNCKQFAIDSKVLFGSKWANSSSNNIKIRKYTKFKIQMKEIKVHFNDE